MTDARKYNFPIEPGGYLGGGRWASGLDVQDPSTYPNADKHKPECAYFELRGCNCGYEVAE